MESSQNISKFTKKYKQSLLISLLISIVTSIGLYILGKDVSSFVVGSFPLLFTIVYILFHESYFSLLIPFVLCSFLISLIMVNKYTSTFLKTGSYVSVILLTLASLFTIYSIIASISYIRSAINYPSPQGKRGIQGMQGERGNKATKLIKEEDILYNELLKYAQNDYREQIQVQNPNKIFKKDTNYLKNVFVIEKIETLLYTSKGQEFIKEKRINMKTCCDEQEYYKKIIDPLREEIRNWFIIFLKYENGRSILETEFLHPNNINVYITSKDKNKGLQSPYEELKNNTTWNW
jgi:hypothetical protein